MRHWRLKAWIALAVLIVAGCSGGRAALTAEEQAQPVVFTEFSIRPPAGEGWVHSGQDAAGVAFGRRRSATHSVLATANAKGAPRDLASQEALLTYLREGWAREDGASPRYRNRRTQARAEPALGRACVRYAIQSDDYGAANRGDAPFLVQRSVGLLCVSPARPRRMIRASYSERALPGEGSAAFEADAERFLATLRLAGAP